MIEIESLPELKHWISTGASEPATFIAMDLTPFEEDLAGFSLCGCAFLGCRMGGSLLAQAQAHGAVVVADRADLPFRVFRPLYSVADIYQGFDPAQPGSWAGSFDHTAYGWFMDAASKAPKKIGLANTVAARTHDTAMERAVGRFLGTFSGQTVAFMGGHDRDRTDAAFLKVASLARTLRRAGKMIVTGGGPGFMEAANLGAFLAPYDDAELGHAIGTLSAAPKYTETHNWLKTACEVRSRLLGDWKSEAPEESSNLGIPTWLYGHEPPNLFSTHIGKFFFNSLREDGLVTVADGGIVFAEGNAGTVQEIFQDVTQNYYRPAGVAPTPMVLFNSTPGFWNLPCDRVVDATRKKPVHQLLSQLAAERKASAFAAAVLLSDDPDEIVHFLIPQKANPSLLEASQPGEVTRGTLWQSGFTTS